jgi:1,4-dihydroxy-2-naphthoate polyprenyltransferase
MKPAHTTSSRATAWLLATRPRTLPAALAPVAVGTAAAIADRGFAALPALAALSGALLLQIAVNLANDYFDYHRGIDTERRVGPMRVTQSGLIAPGRVLGAMWLVLALAGICGAYLATVGGWPIIVIGLASIAGVIGYSGGPYPLASHGLGDLFVFIFFGPVAVCGTYFVQTHTLTGTVVMWSVPPGLMIAAILVVNNLRDMDTDRAAGKRTLAVMIGPHYTRIEYTLLVLLAYAFPPAMLASGASQPLILLPLITFPLGGLCIRKIYQENGRVLNARLGATAMLALGFSILLSIGMTVS